MAGLWDYVTTSGGEMQKRVNVSLVYTELSLVAHGVHTAAEALAFVEAELGEALPQAARNDLSALVAAISAGAVQSRLVYGTKLQAMLNAGELGLVDETTWRTVLGI